MSPARPYLTVGMATFNDFDGVWFTVQALHLAYDDLIRRNEIEIVIVDQSSSNSHQQAVAGVAMNVPNCRRIPFTSPTGTSPSRNKVFEEAHGQFVLCVDSHVLFRPWAIRHLLEDIQTQQLNERYLYQGPLFMDNLMGICTHYNPEWRAEMYGTWGRAWRCTCAHFNFSCIDRGGIVRFIPLDRANAEMGDISGMHLPIPAVNGWEKFVLAKCPNCAKPFPESLGWPGHEATLEKIGYYSLGFSPDDLPFAVHGHGLGIFGCYKDAWLGFPSACRGFGAEELNIHERYRQAGSKTLILPYLQWVHRFNRPSGVPYPLSRYDKVRNYVIWHNLLKKPLDDIHEHFVKTRLMSQGEWDWLVADPEGHLTPPNAPQPVASVQMESPKAECGTCNESKPTAVQKSAEEIFDTVVKLPRDFELHMPILRALADECQHVTEFSIRRESFIALAASRAKAVYSLNLERNDPFYRRILELQPQRFGLTDREFPDPIPTDLLFFNDKHTGDRLSYCLQVHGPHSRHYIVIHNSGIYGEVGEDGKPGLLPALRAWLRSHPEWSVIRHIPDQYGLTILSCQSQDKKQKPGKAAQIVNFAKAIAEHVASGAEHATVEVMQTRLDICSTCPNRNNDDCGVCGCPLLKKASWKVSECPIGLWPIPVSE